MGELPPKVAAYRAEFRAREIGPGYRSRTGWMHLALITMGVVVGIVVLARHVQGVTGTELLALPAAYVFANVVEYLVRARDRGAYTVALTNDTGSALAAAADDVLPLAAGPEVAVAATKTYLNQLAALGLLAASAAGKAESFAGGVRTARDTVARLVHELEPRIASVALPFAYAGRMFVVGRGAEYATAREIALKLLETCRVAAEPLTATDLAHGPVAALDPSSARGRSPPTTRPCPRCSKRPRPGGRGDADRERERRCRGSGSGLRGLSKITLAR